MTARRATQEYASCPPLHSKSSLPSGLFLHTHGQQKPADHPHTSYVLQYPSFLATDERDPCTASQQCVAALSQTEEHREEDPGNTPRAMLPAQS
ncbi:hypothetical protein ACTXO7_14090 [Glutamicibacter ardleyensis]